MFLKIEKIDPYFRKEECNQANKVCYSIPCEKFDLYGVYYYEDLHQFIRMNYDVAREVSDKVGYLATQTSGGRLRFATDSSVIGIAACSLWHMMETLALTT